jgi:hypothetical protein
MRVEKREKEFASFQFNNKKKKKNKAVTVSVCNRASEKKQLKKDQKRNRDLTHSEIRRRS